MIIDTTNNYDSPVRLVGAKVELWEGSTLADTYNQYYGIKEFSIERVGESKFFGFGICQRFNIHLIDLQRYMHITTADSMKVSLSTGGNYIQSFPEFYVTETHRDENTNELSITAYDALYKAGKHYVNELELETPYTILGFAEAVSNYLDIGLLVAAEAANSFSLAFDTGANFEGSETLREALNAIAEATQTIYYINSENTLVFKRLSKDGVAVATIDKEKYITLESGDNRRLAAICHATELGDNVTASLDITGTTQFVRNNPFWDLREDIGQIVENALSAIGGITINQFSCYWRGNPLIELGDKISLETKDGNYVSSFLLDDVIKYDGSLSQDTRWSFEDSEETESNPSNIGDALKRTFARVDKVNKQIDLYVSESEDKFSQLTMTVEGLDTTVKEVKREVETITGVDSSFLTELETRMTEAESNIAQNAENIELSVSEVTTIISGVQQESSEAVKKLEEDIANNNTSISQDIQVLSQKVEASVTAEDLTIEVQNQLTNGVDKVTTSTGFTFNEEGLTVSKTGSEMETTITEDGMTVYRNEEAVLTANNIGVNATNLHATTYLIVGLNSRFEDFGDNRTGCFWIGGNG